MCKKSLNNRQQTWHIVHLHCADCLLRSFVFYCFSSLVSSLWWCVMNSSPDHDAPPDISTLCNNSKVRNKCLFDMIELSHKTNDKKYTHEKKKLWSDEIKQSEDTQKKNAGMNEKRGRERERKKTANSTKYRLQFVVYLPHCCRLLRLFRVVVGSLFLKHSKYNIPSFSVLFFFLHFVWCLLNQTDLKLYWSVIISYFIFPRFFFFVVAALLLLFTFYEYAWSCVFFFFFGRSGVRVFHSDNT